MTSILIRQKLRSKAWTILNVDLFSTLIEYLSKQEGGELIEALIQEEKLQYKASRENHLMPLSVLQNSLRTETQLHDQKLFNIR